MVSTMHYAGTDCWIVGDTFTSVMFFIYLIGSQDINIRVHLMFELWVGQTRSVQLWPRIKIGL